MSRLSDMPQQAGASINTLALNAHQQSRLIRQMRMATQGAVGCQEPDDTVRQGTAQLLKMATEAMAVTVEKATTP
jgi:hypothetical protein